MGTHTLRERTLLWLEEIRPHTLLASLLPVVVGGALALLGPAWNVWKFLGCVAVAQCLQIAVNLFNDVQDAESGADNDRSTGMRRLVASGVLQARDVKQAGILALAGATFFAALVVPLERAEIWIAGALAMIAALSYTAGKKSYGYQGLGEIVCFIFFGPVAVLGTCAVAGGFYSLEGLLLGVSAGCLSVCVLEANNLRDIEGDRAAEKKTLAVRFGRKVGERIYLGAMMTAITLTAVLAAGIVWLWGAAIVLTVGGGRANAALRRAQKPQDYNTVLQQTLLWMSLWGIAVALGLNLARVW